MHTYVVLALLGLAAASALPTISDQDWEFYKMKFNKNYSTDREHKYRKRIFFQNRDEVLSHNERFAAGLVSHSREINKFSDWGIEEFNSYCSCAKFSNKPSYDKSNIAYFNSTDYQDLPTYVNWAEKGAVTDVKNQGNCGSCWTFAATGTVEGAHFLKTGKLVSLSEQNIIDCDRSFYDEEGGDGGGCNGGEMYQALDFIRDEGGIDTEESYPYLEASVFSHPKRKCHYESSKNGATIKRTIHVRTNNTHDLMAAVATQGPISVGVFAYSEWKDYQSGVFTSEKCSLVTEPNHGVLLVGYGTDENGLKYWLIKNSWGYFWGDNGYMKLARGNGVDCMILHEPIYPEV